MKVLNVIGADLSKKTIDFANPLGEHLRVTNDQPGYDQLMEWIKNNKTELLITAGAGDIDTLVEPIKKIIGK